MTKSTFDFKDEVYDPFLIIVRRKEGGRKAKMVLEELIKKYNEENAKYLDAKYAFKEKAKVAPTPKAN